MGCAEFASTLFPALREHNTLTALALQLLFYLINLRGVRQGAWTQNVTSIAKMVLLFAIIAAIFVAVPHAQTAAPSQPGSLAGLILGYTLVIGAYSGWNAPAYFAEEKVDPAKQIPRALFMGVGLVTALYTLLNLALRRALPLAALQASPLPAATAMSSIFGGAASAVVAVVAILTALNCLNGGIMMASRVLFGLSRDGLFLPLGTRVNAGGTPYIAMLVTALFSGMIAATGTFETIFLMIGIFAVTLNVLMTLSLFCLRSKDTQTPRAYRARGYPALALATLTLDSCLLLALISTNPHGAIFGASLILLAFPVWVALGRNRVRVAARPPL